MKRPNLTVSPALIDIEQDGADRSAQQFLRSVGRASTVRLRVGRRTFMAPALLYELHMAVMEKAIRLEVEAESLALGKLWVLCIEANQQAWELGAQ